MNTKLTLNVDKGIVEEAKRYARKHRVSLSNLIENYLNSLVEKPKEKKEVSALVESLTGIIPDTKDERNEYRDHLQQKYM
ncbi:DUF6364 family protein [Bacteroides sp. 51]|uniref:DUF6364 family protein n=1 Tax=Bacteroides sp. 51 TaxID=2302938 RepID=UPI0013D58A84|nr:DUF6364 family protein [Bacteroides sp. 51]NDV83266.1 hypothetical protein [Bacteroides sp. 51]